MARNGASVRQQPERVALLGVVVNAALALVKLLAGIFGHSFALVADAVESLVDVAGSAVIWGALVYGGRPADEEHPFGHGKIEAMAAMAVALLVVAAGIGIGAEAVRHILTPQERPAAFTLVVLLTVVLVKEAMYRAARRAADRTGSHAGHADAGHHRSDAITSLFAFGGISVALVGGEAWAPADDWAALLASGVIMLNGARMVRGPFSELLDAHAPDVGDGATRIALGTPDVRGVERCEARRSGRGYRVVMHAEVDPAMTVADSHRLTGIVKQRVRDAMPEIDSVLIHVEPHRGGGETGVRR
ncbi:MAG TPA: cation diffusion facilitator family transporter [Phycisphaerales bacterium]|nr:cation diffusion facilitator family transporter [Phycisphaerales bacterium]